MSLQEQSCGKTETAKMREPEDLHGRKGLLPAWLPVPETGSKYGLWRKAAALFIYRYGACPAADISGSKRKQHARSDAGKAQKIVRKTR